jgi:hypothetical protein
MSRYRSFTPFPLKRLTGRRRLFHEGRFLALAPRAVFSDEAKRTVATHALGSSERAFDSSVGTGKFNQVAWLPNRLASENA